MKTRVITDSKGRRIEATLAGGPMEGLKGSGEMRPLAAETIECTRSDNERRAFSLAPGQFLRASESELRAALEKAYGD